MITRVNVKKSGNWSDPDTWYGGVFPLSGDSVYANGNTIVIDQDIEVNSIINEQTYSDITGGKFIVNDGITIKTNVYSGPETIIDFDGNRLNIIGNIMGCKGTFSNAAIKNNGLGTISILGDIQGGWGLNTYGVENTNTGTIEVSGNLYFGLGSYSYAIYNDNNGKIIINGIESTENGGYGDQPPTLTYG